MHSDSSVGLGRGHTAGDVAMSVFLKSSRRIQKEPGMRKRIVVIVIALVFVLVLLPTSRWCGLTAGELTAILGTAAAFFSAVAAAIPEIDQRSHPSTAS
ncbi:hypothetical protein [Actinoplanes sp. HUAS TT8]|uniref:hypothetical protein n=1 Tax=Actinoplanes sp. HUAS TT8 TaxID=3447453 RepID=UPI003F51D770